MKKGLQTWNPNLQEQANRLQEAIANCTEPEALEQAVRLYSRKQTLDITKGIMQVWKDIQQYQRPSNCAPVVWRKGSTTLYDYHSNSPTDIKNTSSDQSPIILCIPSLINKAYIFDLTSQHSMLDFLTDEGSHPFLLDWGEPSLNEDDFDIDDYITQRLIPAIEYLYNTFQRPIWLVGYCMGGMFALATAQISSKYIAGIALLATPWDFSASSITPFITQDTNRQQLETLLQQNTIPGSWIHNWLYLSDPWPVHQKYERFACTPLSSEQRKLFIDRECWLHDHVALTGPVARECFIDWAIDNTPHLLQWRINEHIIDPQSITCPTLIVTAQYDRIVPPNSIQPLIDKVKHATILTTQSGHVGMMAGKNAEQEVWKPLAQWLQTR